MRRWLPSPLLSAGLFALWIMLNRSVSPGHVLLGLALAVVMPLLIRPLRVPAGPMRRPLVLAAFVLRVGGDVVRSGLDVALGIVRMRRRPPSGRFVTVPLELRDAHALAALAVITTVIPGTVWSELAPDRSALLLHVFDLDDEAAFIDHFKQRYEAPLKEIFE